MRKAKPFDNALAELADQIARDAMQPDAEFSMRLEAFRMLIQYGKDIVAKRPPEDDGDVFDFNSARKRVATSGASE